MNTLHPGGGGFHTQESLTSKLDSLARMHSKGAITSQQTLNSVQPVTRRETGQVEESENQYEAVIEATQGAELVMCELCYNEERKIDFFALNCGHSFCKYCHEDFLSSQIEQGKVMNMGCMQNGCDEEYSDEEVKQCTNEALYRKYMRFVNNAKVDLDPDLRWCPKATCDGFVRK